jgi:hypothetical protein
VGAPCHLAISDGQVAEAWLHHAVRLGGQEMRWRVVEEVAGIRSVPIRWIISFVRGAAIAEFPRRDLPAVHVSPDLFGGLDERGAATRPADGSIVIQCTQPAGARAALQRAIKLMQAHGIGVGPLEESEHGPSICLASSGPEASRAMRVAVHLVLDELLAHDINCAYLRPVTGHDFLPREVESSEGLPPELADAARESTDGHAAFAVARWFDEHRLPMHADAWFKYAAARGPFDLFWRIADYYCLDARDPDREEARTWWMRALSLAYPRWDAPRIRISRFLFAPIVIDGRAGYGMDFGVVVRSADPERAAAALSAAAERFSVTTADGRELPDRRDVDAGVETSDDWTSYTPNWISDVILDQRGPSLTIDCKDIVAPGMARTMIEILIHELLRAGVSEALVTSPQLP